MFFILFFITSKSFISSFLVKIKKNLLKEIRYKSKEKHKKKRTRKLIKIKSLIFFISVSHSSYKHKRFLFKYFLCMHMHTCSGQYAHTHGYERNCNCWKSSIFLPTFKCFQISMHILISFIQMMFHTRNILFRKKRNETVKKKRLCLKRRISLSANGTCKNPFYVQYLRVYK